MRLEVKDVCFSYQDGELKKEIFNGASCEFLDKKFYCITGPSKLVPLSRTSLGSKLNHH